MIVADALQLLGSPQLQGMVTLASLTTSLLTTKSCSVQSSTSELAEKLQTNGDGESVSLLLPAHQHTGHHTPHCPLT